MLHGITSAIHRFFERNRQDRTRSELLALGDHALADIGLTRTEIEAREDPISIRDVNQLGHETDRIRRTH